MIGVTSLSKSATSLRDKVYHDGWILLPPDRHLIESTRKPTIQADGCQKVAFLPGSALLQSVSGQKLGKPVKASQSQNSPIVEADGSTHEPTVLSHLLPRKQPAQDLVQAARRGIDVQEKNDISLQIPTCKTY